jgi:leucyl-tRNA synthetase
MFKTYNPSIIEAKWRRAWEESRLYRTEEGRDKPKFYCLDFFPYPSGEGLHVGHCRNYIPTDVISRYLRMQGRNVLHPMGWDAFGEPAEQHAITLGVHPRVTTERNTANYRRQMDLIGCSYDWSREIDSSKPEFYRWTQWFFLRLYKRGLAYRDTNWQWWCPECRTTLSSHESAGGVCWRGHTGVTKREIPAWYFRITAYADELLAGLDEIDWPENIKTMQRNWIGRSEGWEVQFQVNKNQDPVLGKPNSENWIRDPDHQEWISIFTTRLDTLNGATFLALAPEHPLVEQVTTPGQRSQVGEFSERIRALGEIDRGSEPGEKSGVFTGSFAINPANQEKLPIWLADYVLPGYGGGAVMGVPAHDPRDYEFALKYDLPLRIVVAPPGSFAIDDISAAYTGPGTLINSGVFDGLANAEAGQRIGDFLESEGMARRAVQYHMRDWLISRQRYWGTPIPIVYCSNCGDMPVPEDQLPVHLPDMADFAPDASLGSASSPLARNLEFVRTTCPECGGPARRETDTMGGFACSSWYFLRFISPNADQAPFEPEAARYWMPVDLYVGGAEHAVLHLLYARFWTRFLAGEGLLSFREPFRKLLNQGQLLAPDGKRMSKSRGNVITPDSIVERFGADALRVYELFMAPFDQDVTWSGEGFGGARRFLNRIWMLYASGAFEESGKSQGRDRELESVLHKTIRDVGERIATFRLNTMVSALMEFCNELTDRYQAGNAWKSGTFHRSLVFQIILIAPPAP